MKLLGFSAVADPDQPELWKVVGRAYHEDDPVTLWFPGPDSEARAKAYAEWRNEMIKGFATP